MIILQLRSIPSLKDNQAITLFVINRCNILFFYKNLGENKVCETISELDEEDFLDENGGHEVHDDFKKDDSLSSNVNPFQSHSFKGCVTRPMLLYPATPTDSNKINSQI